ncbi:hypothetical protein [Sulfurimonas sp.]|uniref:hypothetical protein n=1 Tax=Sulfurimonas sp. TaxID=2022749 RepID=UPI002B4927EC|nr:hypothetical protein [Sulfurimonas sp.]
MINEYILKIKSEIKLLKTDLKSWEAFNKHKNDFVRDEITSKQKLIKKLKKSIYRKKD